MKFTLKLMLTVFLALSVETAMAKGHKKSAKAEADPKSSPHIYGQVDFAKPLTVEEMAQAKKDIKVSSRGVADTIDEETALTEDMKNFRNEIIGGVVYYSGILKTSPKTKDVDINVTVPSAPAR